MICQTESHFVKYVIKINTKRANKMYEYSATVIRVLDGDSLLLQIDLGLDISHKIKVRLARINAPETHGVLKESEEYKKGIASTRFVEDFVKLTNNNVRIVTVKDRTEKYGRYLAEIYASEGPFKDKNLNEEMLTFGFATEYTR